MEKGYRMNTWREGMEWIHGERDGINAWRLRMEYGD